MVLYYNQRLHSPFTPKKRVKQKQTKTNNKLQRSKKATKNAFINLNLEGVGGPGETFDLFCLLWFLTKSLGSRERKFDFLVQPSWEHVIKEH